MRLIDRLHDLARDNGGLVTATSAQAAGISTQRLTEFVRGGLIARVFRGVYAVAAAVTTLPDPRQLTVAWRVVLSHESAALWWDVDLPGAPGRVHVTAPRSRGRWRDAVRGVCLHRANLSPAEVATLRGVRVTTPLRTATDLAKQRALAEAVAIVDAFLRARLITVDEFERAAAKAQGPGARQLRRVAELVDPQCGSILESLTRVLLCLAGLQPEATQFPLRHPRTGWIGYVDFAWPSLRVVLEADGYEYHAERGVFQSDRRRWSAMSRADWRSGIVTWFDVTRDPEYVVALVRDLLASAAANRAS